MWSLILTVVSISLFAASLLATVNYINPLKKVTGEQRDAIVSGLYELETGFDSYVTANASQPSTLADLTPEFVFTPPSIMQSATWTLSSGGSDGRYVCLSGTFNEVNLSAALMAQQKHSPQAYFIHSSCGVTSNAIPALSGGTATVAITYWLSTYI
jgi:hypothetical protein